MASAHASGAWGCGFESRVSDHRQLKKASVKTGAFFNCRFHSGLGGTSCGLVPDAAHGESVTPVRVLCGIDLSGLYDYTETRVGSVRGTCPIVANSPLVHVSAVRPRPITGERQFQRRSNDIVVLRSSVDDCRIQGVCRRVPFGLRWYVVSGSAWSPHRRLVGWRLARERSSSERSRTAAPEIPVSGGNPVVRNGGRTRIEIFPYFRNRSSGRGGQDGCVFISSPLEIRTQNVPEIRVRIRRARGRARCRERDFIRPCFCGSNVARGPFLTVRKYDVGSVASGVRMESRGGEAVDQRSRQDSGESYQSRNASGVGGKISHYGGDSGFQILPADLKE